MLFQSYEGCRLPRSSWARRLDPAHEHRPEHQPGLICQAELLGIACRPIAMRDTDLGWMTKIVPVQRRASLQAVRSEKSHAGAWQPRQRASHWGYSAGSFLELGEGLVEGRDYRTLRFEGDVGKHGDTGASEVEVRSSRARQPRRCRRDRQSLFGKRCAPRATHRRAH